MNNGREVVVISGVRTAIGDFGGALKDFAPTDLGARCVREALSRAKVAPEEVGHVVFGNVIHTEPKDMYLSRVCAINGGIPKEVPAVTLNRLCGSGLQAIVTAAQIVALGDADVAVAGGVGIDEPRQLLAAERPLGLEDGRPGGDGFADRRAVRPVRRQPHGRDRGKRRGEVRHQSRNAGRVLGGKPPPRGQRDQERLVQVADPADRDQGPQGHEDVRHRRTRARRDHHGQPWQTQAGVQEGRFRHPGQRLGHQRRRRGSGADGAQACREKGSEADGAAGGLRSCRGGTDVDGPGTDPGRARTR